MASVTAAGIRFSGRELKDLGAAWIALGVAFTFFLVSTSPARLFVNPGASLLTELFVRVFALSLLTVGVGFLLHELAHKVVAIRFGQVAEFRADYTMLALAVGAALAGFLFAAPGAVYHRGNITKRENGLIAVAGPLTNVALVAVFAPLYLFGSGFVLEVGQVGLFINAALAAFNMLPFGPLDGRKVLSWSTVVFGAVAALCVVLVVGVVLYVGFPF